MVVLVAGHADVSLFAPAGTPAETDTKNESATEDEICKIVPVLDDVELLAFRSHSVTDSQDAVVQSAGTAFRLEVHA